MLYQVAQFALFIVGVCLFFGILGLMADIHHRHTEKQRREGWREHRAYMDSLEPKRWDA